MHLSVWASIQKGAHGQLKAHGLAEGLKDAGKLCSWMDTHLDLQQQPVMSNMLRSWQLTARLSDASSKAVKQGGQPQVSHPAMVSLRHSECQQEKFCEISSAVHCDAHPPVQPMLSLETVRHWLQSRAFSFMLTAY